MALLTITDLHVSVGAKQVLQGIDLQVDAGEVVAVMGPNGSGKSTLVSTIMGRPTYTVDQGSIAIEDQDIAAWSTDRRARRGLALISQSQPEIPGVRVDELITSMYRFRDLDTGKVTERIVAEANDLALDQSLLNRWVNVDLSGGERKKLETLLVSAVPQALVIGDEIDSGLDIDALRDVARRLRRLNDEQGTALLLITHYPRLLREIRADRVVVLVRGKMVAEGGMDLAVELEKTGYQRFGVEAAEYGTLG
ncbi:MAG: Fe-S cluster assembly ATPase SufC [Ferrimicrobium sp.]|uniref:Fe-S cluster assembly ATPase SufC n=1 Tax=Ferrimicrobium acidiphilum TaxID=121039 RepID=A0ABV3Y1E6_9ACTN|nr:Fe-S cluster assembly ATPase SufC [Ferrimicrobium sp.]MCL5973976.1 Fe-S cluster assembly ATPase SufC [Actinomycetota bacterium]